MNTRLSACLSLWLLVIPFTRIAIAVEADNLLPNGSFEEIFEKKVKNTRVNNGPLAAPESWRQFINVGNLLVTEVIEDKEFAVDGKHVVRVTADGAGSGLSMFYLVGNMETVTYSAWVYVLDGRARIGVGSNANGFLWATATRQDEWEFLEVTAPGAIMPEQVIVYSRNGPADLYVDAAWVNFGDKTTNPITTLEKPKAIDANGKLAMTWAHIKAQTR